MERELAIFDSHEAAEAADRAYYAALTPQERLDLLLELIRREREALGEAGRRLARVCRVAQLGER
jgi:hypothetical protein